MPPIANIHSYSLLLAETQKRSYHASRECTLLQSRKRVFYRIPRPPYYPGRPHSLERIIRSSFLRRLQRDSENKIRREKRGRNAKSEKSHETRRAFFPLPFSAIFATGPGKKLAVTHTVSGSYAIFIGAVPIRDIK